MSTPFKMKGSPMQRNFGIGSSPMRIGGLAKAAKKVISKLGSKATKAKEKATKWKGHYKVGTPDKHGKGYIDIMSDRTKKGGKVIGRLPYAIDPKTMKVKADVLKKTYGHDAIKFGGAIIKQINK